MFVGCCCALLPVRGLVGGCECRAGGLGLLVGGCGCGWWFGVMVLFLVGGAVLWALGRGAWRLRLMWAAVSGARHSAGSSRGGRFRETARPVEPEMELSATRPDAEDDRPNILDQVLCASDQHDWDWDSLSSHRVDDWGKPAKAGSGRLCDFYSCRFCGATVQVPLATPPPLSRTRADCVEGIEEQERAEFDLIL